MERQQKCTGTQKLTILVIDKYIMISVVTKAVYPDAEAPGFKAESEAVAFETEAKIEAVDPKIEAKTARQYVNKSHMWQVTWAVSLTHKAYKHFLT